jgi:hypothetical protein
MVAVVVVVVGSMAGSAHPVGVPAPNRLASAEHQRQQAAVQHPARTQPRAQPLPPAPLRPGRPYLIYDSVTPSAIPAHHEVATYATGDYAVSPSQVAACGPVVWIDTTGTDPAASAIDVEPGNATPSDAASWAIHKLSVQPNGLAWIYTMRSEWPAAQAAVGTIPSQMRSHVRWWIADPTGVSHIVPGSSATQWYWGSNYDITTATQNV